MTSNILKSKYRLLVLIDQTKSSYTALRNAVNLAKVVDAGIDVLYVKPPTQVVEHDNQIAVMRKLEEDRIASKKALQKLVSTISESENIPVIYSFTFGNVIAEIQNHITKTQPDIVVIGKRKTKMINFLGDGLTSYLLKNHKGEILISGDEKNLGSYTNVSLGFLDDVSMSNEIKITQDLRENSSKPFTLFKFKKTNSVSKTEDSSLKSKEQARVANTKVFEFEVGADNSDSLSKYIKKNKIELLCIKRTKDLKQSKSLKLINAKIRQTINKINVPVLILAN